ncbi:MAG TPA: MerR family transcriptional regulator [Ktedonosporobacter sp.]|nr:MerR family transcriptional regulator [Ktedonosporobacter sp.]
MNQHVYQTSQFAQKAAVSVRTLRFYDKVGLLSPSSHTEAGYRLYTEADFFRLQRILALKFLGFSLGEIKQCLSIGPTVLLESLAMQKAMMQEKKEQLDTIIQAIDETEKLLQTNTDDWEAIVRVIQVMQTEQNNDWRKKYFTEEQLQQMEDLSKKHYSEEQRQQIAEWGKDYTEEDQQVATQQWATLIAELRRIIADGQDPASPEAQALAEQWYNLVQQFTHGDEGILNSLANMYKDLHTMPAEQRPFTMPYNQEESAFMCKALAMYKKS